MALKVLDELVTEKLRDSGQVVHGPLAKERESSRQWVGSEWFPSQEKGIKQDFELAWYLELYEYC